MVHVGPVIWSVRGVLNGLRPPHVIFRTILYLNHLRNIHLPYNSFVNFPSVQFFTLTAHNHTYSLTFFYHSFSVPASVSACLCLSFLKMVRRCLETQRPLPLSITLAIFLLQSLFPYHFFLSTRCRTHLFRSDGIELFRQLRISNDISIENAFLDSLDIINDSSAPTVVILLIRHWRSRRAFTRNKAAEAMEPPFLVIADRDILQFETRSLLESLQGTTRERRVRARAGKIALRRQSAKIPAHLSVSF